MPPFDDDDDGDDGSDNGLVHRFVTTDLKTDFGLVSWSLSRVVVDNPACIASEGFAPAPWTRTRASG